MTNKKPCHCERIVGLDSQRSNLVTLHGDEVASALRTHPQRSLAMTGLLLLTVFSLLALSLSSCRMNPNMQTPGQTYLQGEWQQDSVPMQKQLISYSLYHIKFDCDSFFMTIKTFSKANYSADSCMANGRWTEYTRGHYQQRNDTLFLKGDYANANFTIKENPGCLHAGVYKEIFKVNKKTDSLIQFSSTSGVIPVVVRLIKRTTCTVKPL